MTAGTSIRVSISSTHVQRNFGDVVRRVYSGEEHFVVERDGLPVAAIISMAEYDELMKEIEQREKRVQRFGEVAQALGKAVEESGLSEEEVMEKLEQAREELYQKGYGAKSSK